MDALSAQAYAKRLILTSLTMWTSALFLPAYIINPEGTATREVEVQDASSTTKPRVYKEVTMWGYSALGRGVFFTLFFGLVFFVGTGAVFGNIIIAIGLFNLNQIRLSSRRAEWAVRGVMRKPATGLKTFGAIHILLIACSFWAFSVDLQMYFNEGGVGVRDWVTGTGTYLWLASLIAMTAGNYFALFWRQMPSVFEEYPPPLPGGLAGD
jgi:hypothetical protein